MTTKAHLGFFGAAAMVALGCQGATWTPSGTAELDWTPAPTAEVDEPILQRYPQFGFDDAVAPDRDAEEEAGVLHAESGAPTMHFINFSDGTTTIKKGSVDNAPMDTSYVCSSAPSAYPKFKGTDEDKKFLVNNLARMLNDFNIILTTTRPATGPYSMEMVGPAPSSGAGASAGVGPADCGNRSNVNISFTYLPDPVTTAQESGHGWGLEHVDVQCDVMGAGYTSKKCATVAMFGYQDVSGSVIKGNGPCGPATQNSHQLLLKNLGMWQGGVKPDPFTGAPPCDDKDPPTVTIDMPSDGASVGPNFTVSASAKDDCAGATKAHISVTGRNLEADATGAGPYSWGLVNQDPGTAEIVVDVYDGTGKKSSASIKVHVSADGGGNGGSGAGNGGGTGGTSGGNGAKGATGGCAVAGRTPAGLPVVALAALALGLSRSRSRRRV